MTEPTRARVLGPADGDAGMLGSMGVRFMLSGDETGKPRGQWHTFWNDGSEQARILEMISRAGFERYFDEMVRLLQQAGPPEPSALAAVAARYGLEVDRESIPRLTQEYGLHFGPPAP